MVKVVKITTTTINLSYSKFKAFTGYMKARMPDLMILPSEKLVETVAIQPVATANNGKNYVLAVEFDNFQYPEDHRKTVAQMFPDACKLETMGRNGKCGTQRAY